MNSGLIYVPLVSVDSASILGTTMATTQHPSSKEDILNYLAKQEQASAQELAIHLNISPQATRRHLKDLETENLIEHCSMQAGMGRPQHLYQLSEKGRDRLPASYGDFALSLLDTLAETVGREQVGTILRKQWERKACEYQARVGHGTLQEKVAKLVELRRAEGYMAEWHVVEPESEEGRKSSGFSPNNGFSSNEEGQANRAALSETSRGASMTQQLRHGQKIIITEYNCAISDVARSFPSVCGHELEMFELALDGCNVERTHWLVNGEHRCGYLIEERAVVRSSATESLP
ncbi:MAG: iron-sulfur cluster biosynthesis transcriptional regulator SufR [Elainellaceae cyanobacterium]